MEHAAALVLCLVLLVPSAHAESNLVSQLVASQFSGFLRLSEQADVIPDLEAALSHGHGVTIFAPTNEALVQRTSPALMAFLQLPENKAVLREVVLGHVIDARVSPFQWEGQHSTLGRSALKLSMDAQAFYAHDLALTQFNALVVEGSAVHAVPGLILPASVVASSQAAMEEGAAVRRVLAAAPAPSTSASLNKPLVSPTRLPSSTSTNAAPATVLASVVMSAAAMVLAVLF